MTNENGTIEINITGISLNEGRIVWLEDRVNGKYGCLATADFGVVILAQMGREYEMKKAEEQREQARLRLRKEMGW